MVEISGSVINPGFYPIAEKLDVLTLINFSGGFKPNADEDNIEVLNLEKNVSSGAVAPGSKVFISPSFYEKIRS